MELTPPAPTREAVTTGLVVWALCLAVILVLGLASGVWRVTTALDQLVALGIGTALVVAAGSLLAFVVPVAVYLRLGLQLPLVALVGYVAFWAVAGLQAGPLASGLFEALVISPAASLSLPVLVAVEYVVRAHVLGGTRTQPNGRR